MTAYGNYNTIAGGSVNGIYGDYGTISGGSDNWIFADGGTIAGGYDNIINSGDYSTITGGKDNTVEGTGTCTIGGGTYNSATGTSSTVLGGMYNKAISNYATVLGGFRSKAFARFATVLGGSKNTVIGRYGVVAGYRGKTSADYSAAFSLDGDVCESRADSSLTVCANSFSILDSSGDTYDVMGLFDSRARHLEESETLMKDVQEKVEAHNIHSKRFADHENRIDELFKQVDALKLDSLDYDTMLKAADAMLSRQ
jgi:hypothetical protein